jgi:serine/threonine protein kinase
MQAQPGSGVLSAELPGRCRVARDRLESLFLQRHTHPDWADHERMSDTQPAAEDSKPTAQAALRRLGKYEIQKKLGQGGMGAVYLALDTQLKRTVALKVLPKEKAKNPILVKRFHAEAQTAASLRHDNIILVFEADHADGYDYMAMEFVDGVDAARLVETRGIVPVRRSIEIVRQVAEALDHAAKQGVVHRDIKPANLMIRRDGVVKLADMGLARIIDDTIDTGITRVGTTVGTVDYMSPEQARDSKAADVRSDLYSLGCTWYFLLTGEPPFPEGALTNKLRAHAEKPPPDPRQLNPNVPESVVAVLNRMLAKQPKARYQTPAELIADLDQGAKSQRNIARVLMDDDDSAEIPEAMIAPGAKRIVPDESSSDVEVHEEAAPAEKSGSEKAGSGKSESGKSGRRDKGSSKKRRSKSKPVEEKAAGGGWFFWLKQKQDPSVPAEVAEESSSPSPRRKSSSKSAPEEPEVEDDSPRRKSRATAAPSETDEPADESGPRRRRAVPAEEEVEDDGARRSSRSKSKSTEADEGRESSRSRKNRAVGAGVVSEKPTGSSPSEEEDEATRQKRIDQRNAVMFYLTAAGLVIGGLALGGYVILRISHAFEGPTAAVAVNPFAQGNGVEALPGSEAAKKKAAEDAAKKKRKASGEPDAVDVVSGDAATEPVPDVQISKPPEKSVWELEGLPLWPGEALPPAGTHADVVISSQTGELPYTVINPELSRVRESESLTVRLSGAGPFALRPVDFSKYKRVTITRNKPTDPAPVVVALPDDSASSAESVALIESRNLFVAEGVEFVLDATLFPKAKSVTLVRASACDVRLIGCRVSAIGDADEHPATTVVQLSGAAAARSTGPATTRVWMQDTAIRGDKVTAVDLVTPAVDAILRDTFVWTAMGSGIRCAGEAADADPAVIRNVRLRRTTILSGRQAVEFAGNPDRTVPVELDWRQSVSGGVRDSKQAVVGRFNGWTSNQVRGALGRQLQWRSQQTRYRAFPALLGMDDPAGTVIAANHETWGERWQNPASGQPDEFVGEAWPAAAPKALELIEPRLFSEPLAASRSDDARPGAVFDTAVFTPVETIRAVLNEARQPQIPEFFAVPPPAVKTVEVDLNKDDLAKVVMDPAHGPWVEIVATGGGVRPLGPMIIRDRYVRIRCQSPDRRLTTFQPRQTDDAWITVINGGLAVEGAAFGVTTVDKSSREKVAQPKWYFRLESSDLSLMGCRVQSPLLGGQRTEGLIQVTGNGGPPGRPVPLPQRGYLVVRNSFLSTGGTAIKADMRGRDVHVRDSAVISRADLAILSTGPEAADLPSRVDIRRSTLSGSSSLIRMERTGDGALNVPVEAKFQATVFARPLVKLAQKSPPTLVAVPNGLLNDRGLAWSETRCGYAPEWTRALLREGDSKQARDWAGWTALWGEGAVREPLSGPTDVLPEGDWPQDPTRLDLAHMALSDSCKAAKWDRGRAIGAPIAELAGRLERGSATAPPAASPRPGTKPAGL